MSSNPGRIVRLRARAASSSISGVVDEDERRIRELNDEAARHQGQARRPGRAGTAASNRAHLALELAELMKALALTERIRDGEAGSSSSRETRPASVTRFSSPDRTGSRSRARGTRSAPARVLRIRA